MEVNWEAILVFFSGAAAGTILSAVGQIVATNLTKDKHSLEAKFVPYNFFGTKEKGSHEYARGIVLRNNGDFVERNIEARLKLLKHSPSHFLSITLRLPELVRSTSTTELEEHKQHLKDLQVEATYTIEHLSPKEEVRFDFSAGERLVEIHFSASTDQALTRIHWQHANHKVMHAEAMEHIFGPLALSPDDDEEDME